MSRKDPGSNLKLAAEIAAVSHSVSTVNGAGVDHAAADSVSFLINAGTIGASGTVDAKVQYSADNVSWTDDDGASGNDTAITQIVAAGIAQLNVPNPRGRYSRAVLTVGTAACVVGVASVLGPLRHIDV